MESFIYYTDFINSVSKMNLELDNNNVQNIENGGASIKRTRNVTPVKYPLPFPYTDFEQHHIVILRAYAKLSYSGSKELKYDDFSKDFLGFNSQYVSGNNKFLENIGLLESTKKQGYYKPTKDAIDLANDFEYEKFDNAKIIIRKHVENTWFHNSARAFLEMKKQVSKEELIKHLGYDCKADLKRHKGGLDTLIAYLAFAGLIDVDPETNEIKIVDGIIEDKISSLKNDDSNEFNNSLEVITQPKNEVIASKKEIFPSNNVNVNISIDVTITPEMSDIDIKNRIESIFEALKHKDFN